MVLKTLKVLRTITFPDDSVKTGPKCLTLELLNLWIHSRPAEAILSFFFKEKRNQMIFSKDELH